MKLADILASWAGAITALWVFWLFNPHHAWAFFIALGATWTGLTTMFWLFLVWATVKVWRQE